MSYPGYSLEESYPFAEMQYVYFIAPVDKFEKINKKELTDVIFLLSMEALNKNDLTL